MTNKCGMQEIPMKKVLVFPRRVLDAVGDFRGYCTETAKYLPPLLDPANLSFVDRPAAEKDPTFKQVIPYIVIKVGGLYLQYRRTKRGGDARLHESRSIGVGGHVESTDGNPYIAYENGFFRELYEEVGLLLPDARVARSSIVGMINDDSDEVGRVHFGIVHMLDLPLGTDLRFSDPAVAGSHFSSLGKLKEGLNGFENWSKLVIGGLRD